MSPAEGHSEEAPPSHNRGSGVPQPGSRVPAEWLEAYRMRLAGAERGEISARLERSGIDDPARVLDEVFRDEPRSR